MLWRQPWCEYSFSFAAAPASLDPDSQTEGQWFSSHSRGCAIKSRNLWSLSYNLWKANVAYSWMPNMCRGSLFKKRDTLEILQENVQHHLADPENDRAGFWQHNVCRSCCYAGGLYQTASWRSAQHRPGADQDCSKDPLLWTLCVSGERNWKEQYLGLYRPSHPTSHARTKHPIWLEVLAVIIDVRLYVVPCHGSPYSVY